MVSISNVLVVLFATVNNCSEGTPTVPLDVPEDATTKITCPSFNPCAVEVTTAGLAAV